MTVFESRPPAAPVAITEWPAIVLNWRASAEPTVKLSNVTDKNVAHHAIYLVAILSTCYDILTYSTLNIQ